MASEPQARALPLWTNITSGDGPAGDGSFQRMREYGARNRAGLDETPAPAPPLFTENTLYPVTLVLDERRHLLATLRLWGVVLSANLIGAAFFAVLVTRTAALSPGIVAKVAEDGHRATLGSWAAFFWSAVLGGWAIALVAWLIQSSAMVIGQIALIWTLVFSVGLLGLDHSGSTTIEVMCAAIKSEVHVGHALAWFAAVLLGNIAGGVVITAVLNYGQVRAGEDCALAR